LRPDITYFAQLAVVKFVDSCDAETSKAFTKQAGPAITQVNVSQITQGSKGSGAVKAGRDEDGNARVARGRRVRD